MSRTLPTRIPAGVAMVAAAALVLAACGDDRGTAPQPPEGTDTGEEASGEPEETTEEDPPAFEEAEPEAEEPADDLADEEARDDAVVEPEEEAPVSNEEERSSGEARTGSVDPGLEDEVEYAIDDTVASTGVNRGDVEVKLAERVTWNDGSMGCPRPGEMYTQALVEGYRILLDADGQERAYHGRDGDDPFYCSSPQPANGEGTGGTVDR